MKILIVGGGKMGLSHLAILNRFLDKGSIALCDSSVLSRYLFGKLGFCTFSSLDQALATGIAWQGAVVATPTSSHFPIAHSLLKLGIPCFIEKPLTLDPSKSQILVDLQVEQGTIVQMGLVARFIQPFVRLRYVFATGILGRPLSYRGRMMGNVVKKPDNTSWRTDFQRGGGCLNEYGPHLLDLCRSIFGEVRDLHYARYGSVHSMRGDDQFEIRWEHANGVQADLFLDWCDTSRRKSVIDFSVEFEHGTVLANNAEFSVNIKFDAPIDAEHRMLLQESADSYPVGFYLRGEEFSLQLEIFLQRVFGRQILRAPIDPALAATIQDGFAVDCLIRDIATMGGLK